MAKIFVFPSKNGYDDKDKLELLEKMMEFQEKRHLVGHLTKEMCIDGIALFNSLSYKAETSALKNMCESYSKYLVNELVNIA